MAGYLYYMRVEDGGQYVNNNFTKCDGGTIQEIIHRCDNPDDIPEDGFHAGDALVWNGNFGVILEAQPPQEGVTYSADTRTVWVAMDGVAKCTSPDSGVPRGEDLYVGPFPLAGETVTATPAIARKSYFQSAGNVGRYYRIGTVVSAPVSVGDNKYNYEVMLATARLGYSKYLQAAQPIPVDPS